MKRLEPNTIEGLIFGLQNFDAIETDVRLTKDEDLVIFHDAYMSDGMRIRDLTLEECKSRGLPTFKEFLENKNVQNLAKNGKVMWIEFKPDCEGKKSIYKSISELMHQVFVENVDNSGINKSSIRILSFQKELLKPFARENDFPAYPILPFVNECNNSFVFLKAAPQLLFKSLTKYVHQAQQDNYRGVLFARQFLIGFPSFRHPSYDKMCEIIDSTGMELGTNLGSIELEKVYPRLLKFTDKTQQYPRTGLEKNGGMIIAHRGTGTKGVELKE